MNEASSVRLRAAALVAMALAAFALVAAVSCSTTDAHQATPSANRPTQRPTPAHASGPSTGCHATPVPPGSTDLTIASGGVPRSYLLDIPTGYDGATPYPVVFGLHSLTVDYRVVPLISGFDDMHARYRFIGVSPSGLTSSAPYWNAAPVADNADVTFIADLLDHLEATLCVDTAKVFSLGMSNGAQMSSLLACRIPDRITGIAAIAGVEFNPPCDGAPVPVIAFHGVADPIVPYAGGGLNSVTIAAQNLYRGTVPPGTPTPTGVDETMRSWARHNGCDPTPTETRISPEVRKQVWGRCRAATEIYLVDGGGHGWPGKPQPMTEQSFGHDTTDIDATALIWAFFFDHRT